jgi:hypothetical protein
MLLILTETACPDPVVEACAAFVQAATESKVGYTPEQLTEMVEGELTALNEAGGFFSWFSRLYTGVDSTLAGMIKKEIKGIDTKEKKAAALKEVDDYLSETKGYPVGKMIAMTFLVPGGILHPLISIIWRGLKEQSGETATYRTALEKVRIEIESLKIKGK